MSYKKRKCTRCEKVETRKKDRCSKCGGMSIPTDEEDPEAEKVMKGFMEFLRKKHEGKQH